MLFVAGCITGIVLMLAVMTWFFRNAMIQTVPSVHDFDETVRRVEAAIKAAGWGIPGQLDINAMTAKKGVEIRPRVRIIELCKPEYAKKVLEDQPQFSAMMPCRIGIYERDGKVMVAKLNTGMMSRFLGGVVRTTMARVGKEEHQILAGL